ncbi:hypothetical protein HYV85_02840 [Candidatus Woesearchaeota archaeon]|nr:hypothetical protein [Candidatus Woesearchaeota archaeon]
MGNHKETKRPELVIYEDDIFRVGIRLPKKMTQKEMMKLFGKTELIFDALLERNLPSEQKAER